MAIPALSDYRLWNQRRHYTKLADQMIQELIDAGVHLEELADDPVGVVESIDGLRVIFHKLPGTRHCNVQACYDPHASPPAIYIHESGNVGRDNFSILHELAHHQQRVGDVWSDATEDITDRKFVDKLGEKVANSFAARILIGDDLLDEAFGGKDVSAAGVRWLYENSRASMKACLVRSLEIKGDRVVMQATQSGQLLYSGANGDEIYAPSVDQPQEAVAHAADDLLASATNSKVVHGSYGIQHKSGKSYTNVVLDMALCDDIVLVVATKGVDQRHAYEDARDLFTGTLCHHQFDLAESPGRCGTCGDPRCSECGDCSCEHKQPPPCMSCFMLLSVAEMQAGLTMHREC